MAAFRRIALFATVAVVGNAHPGCIDLPIITENSYNLVEINIGTPPQPHKLLFDTGSSPVWLVSDNCTKCPNNSGFQRSPYDISKSSSGRFTGHYAGDSYIDSDSMGGPVVEDYVSLPDIESYKQLFIDANHSSWADLAGDGFLGLAFDIIAPNGTHSLVETMMSQGLLADHKFGIYYGNATSNTTDQGGILTIGGTREWEYVDGPVTEIPIVKTLWSFPDPEYEVWKVNFSSVSSSVSADAVYLPAHSVATFDTGSGQLSLSDKIIDQAYESLGWNYTAILNGERILYCNEFNSSWSVTFSFGPHGDLDVTIPGDKLRNPGFPAAPGACWPPFTPSNGDYNILGVPFLQAFYSTWDFGAFEKSHYQPTVRFGKSKGYYY